MSAQCSLGPHDVDDDAMMVPIYTPGQTTRGPTGRVCIVCLAGDVMIVGKVVAMAQGSEGLST